jgi:hypothetical protein
MVVESSGASANEIRKINEATSSSCVNKNGGDFGKASKNGGDFGKETVMCNNNIW